MNAADTTLSKIPEQFITNRQGKSHVLFAGLLDLAHREQRIKAIRTQLIQAPTADNGQLAIVHASIESSEGIVFEGIGDASPENVGRMIAPHIVRMAETRAKARALRDLLNIQGAALEELGPNDEDADESAQRTARSTAGRADSRPEIAALASQQQLASLLALLDFAGEAVIDTSVPAGLTAADCVARFKEVEALPATEAHLGKLLVQAKFLHDKYAIDYGAELDAVVTIGAAFSLRQRMEAEYQKQSAPTAPAALGKSPLATKEQLERIKKLQEQLGRPVGISRREPLTVEEAAEAIKALAAQFNARSKPAPAGAR
jgi:hypothetical protein